jgi:hypothetical protein
MVEAGTSDDWQPQEPVWDANDYRIVPAPGCGRHAREWAAPYRRVHGIFASRRQHATVTFASYREPDPKFGVKAGGRHAPLTPRNPGGHMMEPKYPAVFVKVADGASLTTILERVDAAMRKAGVSMARRHEFKGGMPHGYALTIDYVRQWVDTD